MTDTLVRTQSRGALVSIDTQANLTLSDTYSKMIKLVDLVVPQRK